MNDVPLENETRDRKYNSEEYGQALLTVEAVDFYPEVDSWEYDPPSEYESLLGDTRMMPARFRGRDLTHCIVSLHAEFGAVKKKKFVGLRRGVRRGSFTGDPDVIYETSARVSDSTGIYIRPERENLTDPVKSDGEMMWQLASETPITLADNLNMLIEEAHRLFEPRVSTEI